MADAKKYAKPKIIYNCSLIVNVYFVRLCLEGRLPRWGFFCGMEASQAAVIGNTTETSVSDAAFPSTIGSFVASRPFSDPEQT